MSDGNIVHHNVEAVVGARSWGGCGGAGRPLAVVAALAVAASSWLLAAADDDEEEEE